MKIKIKINYIEKQLWNGKMTKMKEGKGKIKKTLDWEMGRWGDGRMEADR